MPRAARGDAADGATAARVDQLLRAPVWDERGGATKTHPVAVVGADENGARAEKMGADNTRYGQAQKNGIECDLTRNGG